MGGQNALAGSQCCVLQGLDGGPLLVADGPCNVGKGYPDEDLVVGVMSYDPDRPEYGECSIQTSVAYYRDWILNTMDGLTPPSECKLKKKTPSPSPEESVDPCEACKVGLCCLSSYMSILVSGSATYQDLDSNAIALHLSCFL